MPIRFEAFTGRIPRLDKRLLPAHAAQEADNVRLTSGRLDPVYSPLGVATVRGGTVKSAFRMYSGSTDYWLNWNEDVDIVRGPIAGDTTFRSYFTSESFEPRVTNLALSIGSTPYPAAWYVLGVTPPVTKSTVSATGGVGAAVSRAYVYAFVTPWGEESAPSPASVIVTGKVDDTWTVSGMDTAPPNTGSVSAATYSSGQVTVTLDSVFGLRSKELVTFSGVLGMTDLNATFRLVSVNSATNQVVVTLTTGQVYTSGGVWTRVAPHNTTNMTKRVYRSVTSGTDSNYYFIAEIPVATTSTVDSASALGETLPSGTWLMPPADMTHVHTLPSGALCGFSGNTFCMSYPYAPYAWPLQYQLTVDYPIMGIGVFGSSTVICTQGTPYIASGVDPASTVLQKLDQLWPCLTKRGIAEYDGGVCYPTNFGLAHITAAGVELLSTQYFSQYDWSALTPSTLVSAYYDGAYFGSVQPSAGGNYILVIHPERGVSTRTMQVDELYTDPGNGNLYAVYQGSVYQVDANLASQTLMNYLSKEWLLEEPRNFGAARIEASFTDVPLAQSLATDAANAATIAANQAILTAGATTGVVNGTVANVLTVNGSNLGNLLTSLAYVTLQLYANAALFFTKTLTSDRIFRLPGGKKYKSFSIRVSASVPVRSIAIADTAISLKKV